ncbi:MAG: hypothetical protein K2X47_17350 [Bdellovibrionales bacterium]|nr:hypothetical protein [Bdellovibrionales bacterium]
MKIAIVAFGLLSLTVVASVTRAQSREVYPASAIPDFTCKSIVTRYVLDRKTGKHVEVETDSVSSAVVPTYIPNPTGPIEFPPAQNLVRFEKFPIFTKTDIVVFYFSKGAENKPDDSLQINLFASFGDKENPQFPQVFPQPIGTTYLKRVNWPLKDHLEAIYASDKMEDGNNYYTFSVYCGVKNKTEGGNRPLTGRSSAKVGMIKVGPRLIPVPR